MIKTQWEAVRFESTGVEDYWNSNSDLVISLDVAAVEVVIIVGEDRPRTTIHQEICAWYKLPVSGRWMLVLLLGWRSFELAVSTILASVTGPLQSLVLGDQSSILAGF
jgi:hypothetical protein